MKVWILSKVWEGSNSKSELCDMNFGSIEINLQGQVWRFVEGGGMRISGLLKLPPGPGRVL